MTVRVFGSVSAVLVAAGLVLAQGNPPKDPSKKDVPARKEPAKPAPGSLEDTLEKSLRNSADIKAAEAKVHEAEAELNRVRQQVLTRATALHSDLNLAKRMLVVAEQSLATQEQLRKQGQVGVEGILAAQAMVEKHRGEVEKLEAELKSLRGEFAISQHRGNIHSVAFSPDGRLIAGTDPEGEVRIWDARDGSVLSGLDTAPWYTTTKTPGVQAPMADRVRKFLDAEVSFEELLKTTKGDFSWGALLSSLQAITKSDIPIHKVQNVAGQKLGIDFDAKGTLPVGAVLQSFEDRDSEIRIVVREYGLLITPKDRVPEGALRVVDFWKKVPDSKPTDAKKAGGN
jgi:outer membrane efflux protein